MISPRLRPAARQAAGRSVVLTDGGKDRQIFGTHKAIAGREDNRSRPPQTGIARVRGDVIDVHWRDSAIVIVERGHLLVEAATSSLPVMAFSAGRAGR
jgi:hypothetical protein